MLEQGGGGGGNGNTDTWRRCTGMPVRLPATPPRPVPCFDTRYQHTHPPMNTDRTCIFTPTNRICQPLGGGG